MDENQITELVGALSKVQALEFVSCCVGRTLPLYQAMEQHAGKLLRSKSYAAVKALVDFVASDLQTADKQEITAQLRKCNRILDFWEEQEWDAGMCIVQSIADCMEFYKTGETGVLSCTENNLEIINQLRSDEYTHTVNSEASDGELKRYLEPFYAAELQLEADTLKLIERGATGEELARFVVQHPMHIPLFEVVVDLDDAGPANVALGTFSNVVHADPVAKTTNRSEDGRTAEELPKQSAGTSGRDAESAKGAKNKDVVKRVKAKDFRWQMDPTSGFLKIGFGEYFFLQGRQITISEEFSACNLQSIEVLQVDEQRRETSFVAMFKGMSTRFILKEQYAGTLEVMKFIKTYNENPFEIDQSYRDSFTLVIDRDGYDLSIKNHTHGDSILLSLGIREPYLVVYSPRPTLRFRVKSGSLSGWRLHIEHDSIDGYTQVQTERHDYDIELDIQPELQAVVRGLITLALAQLPKA